MNHEGYQDPTADNAIKKTQQTPPEIMQVVNMMKAIAGVAGFDVIGRIQLRDRATGKEWR